MALSRMETPGGQKSAARRQISSAVILDDPPRTRYNPLPMSKRRGIMKWTGAVLSVLILGAWAGSLKWSIGQTGSQHTVGVCTGVVRFSHGRDEASDRGFKRNNTNQEAVLRMHEDLYAYAALCRERGKADPLQHSPWGFELPDYASGLMSTWSPSEGAGPKYRFTYVQLPLWLPFLIVALPTGFMFWRDRRRYPPGPLPSLWIQPDGQRERRVFGVWRGVLGRIGGTCRR